eukprot:NODE_1919_length_1336_cov_31.350703_g1824_i0.p1 GENE.NODE_1919_length_1336_cov_31.350703_g1824_i0~~NODE_1919_length_1336_cov_31.350703_g1824_i0.p1  ORF type:complete len:390 (-),score=104.68 NODE_1919_length_1336_cov_31.350703_g1824_i0:76-1245(-)
MAENAALVALEDLRYSAINCRNDLVSALGEVSSLTSTEQPSVAFHAHEYIENALQGGVQHTANTSAQVGVIKRWMLELKLEIDKLKQTLTTRDQTIATQKQSLFHYKVQTTVRQAAAYLAQTARQRMEERSQKGPTGTVTLCYCRFGNALTYWEQHPELMKDSVLMANQLMEDELKRLDGFAVIAKGDTFVAAFESPAVGLEWAASVQEGLLRCPWPSALLALRGAEEELDEGGNMMYVGLRVRMAINTGEPWTHIDPIARRTTYMGLFCNRTLGMLHHARSGEIIVGHQLFKYLKRHTHAISDKVVMTAKGSMRLVGLSTPEVLYSAIPLSLVRRRFLDPCSVFITERAHQLAYTTRQETPSDVRIRKIPRRNFFCQPSFVFFWRSGL